MELVHFLLMTRLREDKRVRGMATVEDVLSSKKKLLKRQHASRDLPQVTVVNGDMKNERVNPDTLRE